MDKTGLNVQRDVPVSYRRTAAQSHGDLDDLGYLFLGHTRLHGYRGVTLDALRTSCHVGARYGNQLLCLLAQQARLENLLFQSAQALITF